MSDESVTVATALYIVKLAARVQRVADPGDSRELASRVADAMEHPDRRVGAALAPKKRGGESEWHAEQRAERNSAYRDLAVAEYGTPHLTPKQARALNRKIGPIRWGATDTIEGGLTLNPHRQYAACTHLSRKRQPWPGKWISQGGPPKKERRTTNRKAEEFHRMAEAEPVEHIRQELLAIAEQYRRLAESL